MQGVLIYIAIVIVIGAIGIWIALRRERVGKDLLTAVVALAAGAIIYIAPWQWLLCLSVMLFFYLIHFCKKLNKEALREDGEASIELS